MAPRTHRPKKAKPAFRRVLLKISGEALAGTSREHRIDEKVVGSIAREIFEVWKSGVEMALVIGGGNIYRGADGERMGMDRVSSDYMGMLGTLINALALQNSLEKLGAHTRVQSAIEMSKVAEPYIRRRALRHLEKGRIVIFAAGTGNPYFTTDTAAALQGHRDRRRLHPESHQRGRHLQRGPEEGPQGRPVQDPHLYRRHQPPAEGHGYHRPEPLHGQQAAHRGVRPAPAGQYPPGHLRGAHRDDRQELIFPIRRLIRS